MIKIFGIYIIIHYICTLNLIGMNNYVVNKNGTVFSEKRGIELKQIIRKGYATVSLYVNGKYKHLSVHRLVAEKYLPNPENKPQVNHKDGNKLNNDVSNLEWVTHSENIRHAIDNNLIKYKVGKNHHRSKSVIDNNGIVYGSIREAARIVNGDPSRILVSIKSGGVAYGLTWKYK